MTESAPHARRTQTILVPLDGLPTAEAALLAAATLARRMPARIILLHAIERDAPVTRHGERHLTSEDDAERYLTALADRLRADAISVTWHVHVVPVGDVARSIATHAIEAGADLIVLSTHAVSDPRTWLIGSVAQGVVRYASPPVLLLRTTAKREQTSFDPAEVIVAIDRERQGEAAIPAAMAMAATLGVPLRLLAVVPTVETIPGDEAAAAMLLPTGASAALDVEAAATADELNALAQRLALTHPDVTTIREVARGDPAARVVAAARAHHGITALATHGQAGLNALWSGSIGARVIARGSGPFLLVHPEPPDSTLAD